MVKADPLDALREVTELRYLAEFRKISAIVEEENRLRRALARLDAQEAAARQSLAQAGPIHLVGADLLWQGWLARNRRDLGTELARVLARKSVLLDRVRRAFGQREAIRQLEREAARRARADRWRRHSVSDNM